MYKKDKMNKFFLTWKKILFIFIQIRECFQKPRNVLNLLLYPLLLLEEGESEGSLVHMLEIKSLEIGLCLLELVDNRHHRPARVARLILVQLEVVVSSLRRVVGGVVVVEQLALVVEPSLWSAELVLEILLLQVCHE